MPHSWNENVAYIQYLTKEHRSRKDSWGWEKKHWLNFNLQECCVWFKPRLYGLMYGSIRVWACEKMFRNHFQAGGYKSPSRSHTLEVMRTTFSLVTCNLKVCVCVFLNYYFWTHFSLSKSWWTLFEPPSAPINTTVCIVFNQMFFFPCRCSFQSLCSLTRMKPA